MSLKKITDTDLQGYGVVGMEDTPNLSARAMQEKVEEVVRKVVIPVMNENIDYTASKQDLMEAVFNAGAGDMQASAYDSNVDGIVNRADNGFFTYTHSKSGNVHYLYGNGSNVKFVSSAPYKDGDVFMIGDNVYPAFLINGDSLPDGHFVRDMAVTCFVHGNCLNFISGGAGLNFKVVGSTAQPASPKENTIWVDTTVDKEATASKMTQVATEQLELYINNSTGVLTAAASNTCYTKYFACEAGREYRFRMNDGQTVLIASYTKLPAKSVAGTVLYGNGKNTGLDTLDYTVTAPAGSTHLAIWYYDSSMNDAVPILNVNDQTMHTEIIADLPDEIPVTEWYFSPSEPEGMKYGSTWIKTGLTGTAEFNALNKNGVFVTPHSCLQWDGTAWVNKSMLVYKDSQWQSCSRLLIDNGSYTSQSAWTNTSGTMTNNTTYNDVNVVKLHSKGPSIDEMISEAVDMSDFTTLELDVITSGSKQAYQASPYVAYRYGVIAETDNRAYSSTVNIITNTGKYVVSATGAYSTLTTVKLDITSLKGRYKVVVVNQSSGSGISSDVGVASVRLV